MTVSPLYHPTRTRIVVATLAVALVCMAWLASFGAASAATSGPAPVTVCGQQFCAGGQTWHLYGASEYQSTSQIGIDHPAATVNLAQQARLNTLRVINFYDSKGSPSTEPYSEARWVKVDAMIAAAQNANMHVLLGLGDYRNILWNNCINPYTSDWNKFVSFVALRRNTVTGRTYGNDPTIAAVSIAGEPLRTGAHTFTAANGSSCTITYGTQDLTNFYSRTLSQFKALHPTVLVNTGGFGYLNWNSGIDWKAIFALPQNDFCDIKTYGGMLNFSPTVASYCASIHKPWMDEEFGWKQSDGDATRANEMTSALKLVRANGSAGEAFWNLGNQLAPTTYDIGTVTPLALAAVQQGAPR